jgi:hypothetical protein
MYTPKESFYVSCSVCGKSFLTNRNDRKYCKGKCREDFWRARNVNLRQPTLKLATGTIGALSELIVCSDLLQRGYEVFRAVSPSCSTDLIASKNDNIFKVEVRTGRYNASKKLYYANQNVRSHVVAVVTLVDKKIWYIPDID